MQYTTLGKTGIQVSPICLGTAFRAKLDDETCAKVIEASLAEGVNFIDTSNVYGEDRIGHAERIIGRVIQGRRDQVVLATKIFFPVGEGPNDRGLSKVHLMREIDRSLQRLGTDHVDILYLHEPDRKTDLEVSLRAADAIVRDGKARHIGLSRYSAWEMSEALRIAERCNLEPVAVTQQRYNLIYREAEIELLPFVRASKLGMAICCPLAIGLLTGRFRSYESPPADTPWGSGFRGFEDLMTTQTDAVVAELARIGERHGKTTAQTALAWLLSHPEVTSVIMGPDRPEHVSENVKAAGFMLEPEERASLDKLSAPPWARRP